MRPVLILLPLLASTACVTPQQSCVARVSQDLNVVNQLIDQTTANLLRGYGIDVEQQVSTYPRMCSDQDSDSTVGWDICNVTYVQNVSVPIAVDLQDEARKLDQLKGRRLKLVPVTEAAVAQCLANNPE